MIVKMINKRLYIKTIKIKKEYKDYFIKYILK